MSSIYSYSTMQSSNTNVLCTRCHAELTVDERGTVTPSLEEQIRSQYIPSDTEVAQIAGLINGCDHDLDLYNSEISKMTDILNDLKRRRDELQQYRDKYKTLLAPVRKLPVEILLDIFSVCCSDFSGCLSMARERNGSPYIIPATLYLSQTCSFWQKVVTSNPRLWSVMSVNLAMASDDRPKLHKLVDLYLERSKGCLLTLDIFAYDRYAEHVESLPIWGWTIFESLLSADQRFRDVSLDLHWSIYRDIDIHFDECLGFDFAWNGTYAREHLQSLKVLWQEGGRPDGDDNPVLRSNLLLNSPALRDLTLESFHPAFQLPFRQLHSIAINDTHHLSEILAALQKCPQLEEAAIRSGHIEEDLTSLRPLTLSSLRSLDFHIMRTDEASAVFSALTLPCITKLSLSIYYGSRVTVSCEDALKDMLIRSSPGRLQELSLEGGGILASDNVLLQILAMTPSLRHLSLKVPVELPTVTLTDRLFQSLTVNSSASTIIPHLRYLKLGWRIGDYESSLTGESSPQIVPSVDTIFNMVSSRRAFFSAPNGMSRLEQFDVYLWCYASAPPAEWTRFNSVMSSRFEALEQEGLRFTLKSPSNRI